MGHKNYLDQMAFIEPANTTAEEYWIKRLSGNLEKISFPYDWKEEKNVPRRMDSHSSRFNEKLFSRIMEICESSDARIYILLAAVLVILINKYTDSKDIVIGTSIFKQEIDAEFLNTILILRNRIDGDMTFKDLLLQVKRTIIEAEENQAFSLDLLLQQLNIPYSRDDNFPLFDIMVILENIQDRKYLQPVKTNGLISFNRGPDWLLMTIEYNTVLYRRESIERIINHFYNICQIVLFAADIRLADVEMLSKQEKERLLVEFNDTKTAYPQNKTIVKLFEEQVDRAQYRIAVEFRDNKLSYGELNRRANRLAGVLRKRNKPCTISGIMIKHSPALIIGIFGILKAGGVYLPIDPTYPQERIRFMLNDSTPAALLADADAVIKMNSYKEVVYLDDKDLYTGDAVNPGKINSAYDPVYIIYTSGTTGRPKGVMIEHRGLVNYICWAAESYIKGEKVNFPLYTSLSFDLTVTSLYTPLITGNAVIIYHGEDNVSLLERMIKDNTVGAIKLTPAHLKLVAGIEIRKEHSIKRLIVGGEKFETALAKDIFVHFHGKIEIYNEYGPTETVVGCMIYEFKPDERYGASIPIGTPADNVQVFLLDTNRKPAPPGAVGEIYISGDGVCRGYLNAIETTDMRIVENPYLPGKKMYRTGDTGRVCVDGNIEFLARIDEQVNIRGYRIEIGEIERLLLNYEKIRDAVVVVRKDKNGDDYLCAYIVSGALFDKISDDELRDYLSRFIPGYMMPHFFMQLETIPLTPNGKVDRKALPVPEVRIDTGYTAPRNKIEEKMVEMWSDVLNIEKNLVSVDANFFLLGGHSLTATILVSKINKELNVKMTLLDFFKTPSIKGLSQYIHTADKEKHTAIAVVEKKEYYPLSSAQKRLYSMYLLAKNSTGYNISQVFQLDEPVDKYRIENTFDSLIRRHDSLRTAIIVENSEPVQSIRDDIDFAIEYYKSGAAAVQRIIDRFKRPFDLGKAPLFRVGVISLDDEKNILMIDMHHTITDAISIKIFFKDFVTIYCGKELPALKCSYKDYAGWQDSARYKKALPEQERYWIERFKGDCPTLDLPVDFKRPVKKGFEGDRVGFTLEQTLTRELKRTAVEKNVTIYMILLAVYNILLSKYSNQEDIIVGSSISGRHHADFQNIMGMFVNTLPMRNFPGRDKVFNDFLMEVKDNTLNAIANQEYQFNDLVGKLGLQGLLDRNPLFDVVFEMVTGDNDSEISNENLDGMGLKYTLYSSEHKTTVFDLILMAVETAESVDLDFVFSTALFKRGKIEKMADHLIEILDKVVKNDKIKLGEISLSHGLAKLMPDRSVERGDFAF